MKKGSGPKNKGRGFERTVAKMLSEWSGKKFIRTPCSGAMHNVHDRRVVSDIVAPMDIDFPYAVECKNVECPWDFSAFLEGTSKTLNDHWEQAREDADREGLRPLLVFTKNYRGIYAMFEMGAFRDTPPASLLIERDGERPLIVCSFEELLQVNSPVHT